jgi:ABC-type branched-subunit amino acid transport system substrate-binding protein
MPNGDQVTLAVEYLLKRRPGMYPRMGLLSQDSILGQEVEEGLHRVSRHYGLEIVGEERYGPGTYDFAPLVDRLWSTRADHVVLGATTWETTLIMREASRLGWFPQFIGLSATVEPKLLIDAGDGADKYVATDYLARPWERAPGITLMIGHTQKYFPRKDTNSLHRHHILGYVSGLLLVEALQLLGKEVTQEGFIDALERTRHLDTHGLASVISYDTGTRLSNSKGRVLQFDIGSRRFIPLTDWSHPLINGRQ